MGAAPLFWCMAVAAEGLVPSSIRGRDGSHVRTPRTLTVPAPSASAFVFRLVPLALALGFVETSPVLAGGLYLNEFASPSMGVAGAGSQAVAEDA